MIASYQLDIDGPAQDVDTSVQSPLQYWQMTRATLTGPRHLKPVTTGSVAGLKPVEHPVLGEAPGVCDRG